METGSRMQMHTEMLFSLILVCVAYNFLFLWRPVLECRCTQKCYSV